MIGGAPQPCPHCQRPTVLMVHGWGRWWVHVGTWRPQCGHLSWATRDPETGSRTHGKAP
jgi:hypothetical protein